LGHRPRNIIPGHGDGRFKCAVTSLSNLPRSVGLPSVVLTVIFATYALSFLVALLTVGSLSNYVRRKPVILAAIIFNALAMCIFIAAKSETILIVARQLQGFAADSAASALGAAILDANRSKGPILISVTTLAGTALGALLTGILVTYAPAPRQLV
jgi:MFS family permease